MYTHVPIFHSKFSSFSNVYFGKTCTFTKYKIQSPEHPFTAHSFTMNFNTPSNQLNPPQYKEHGLKFNIIFNIQYSHTYSIRWKKGLFELSRLISNKFFLVSCIQTQRRQIFHTHISGYLYVGTLLQSISM